MNASLSLSLSLSLSGCLYIAPIEKAPLEIWHCNFASCSVTYQCDVDTSCVCDVPPDDCACLEAGDPGEYDACLTRAARWRDECTDYMCPTDQCTDLDAAVTPRPYAQCSDPANYPISSPNPGDTDLCLPAFTDPVDMESWCELAMQGRFREEYADDILRRSTLGIVMADPATAVDCEPFAEPTFLASGETCGAGDFFNETGSSLVNKTVSFITVGSTIRGVNQTVPVTGWLKFVQPTASSPGAILAGDLTTPGTVNGLALQKFGTPLRTRYSRLEAIVAYPMLIESDFAGYFVHEPAFNAKGTINQIPIDSEIGLAGDMRYHVDSRLVNGVIERTAVLDYSNSTSGEFVVLHLEALLVEPHRLIRNPMVPRR